MQKSRLLLASMLLMSGAIHAQSPDHIPLPKETRTPLLGGPGGGPCELKCPYRGFLGGVRLRDGAWLDQSDGLCVFFRDGQWIGDPDEIMLGARNEPREEGGFLGIGGRYGTSGAAIGGDGGQIQSDLLCPRDQIVTGLGASRSVGHGPFVANLSLQCVQPGQNQALSVQQAPPVLGETEVGQIPVSCKSDNEFFYYAKGMHGRAGIFVDAVGLICNDFRDGEFTTPGEQEQARRRKAREAIEQNLKYDASKLRREVIRPSPPNSGDGLR